MTEEINNSNEQDKSIEEFSKTFIKPQNQSESSAYQSNTFNDMEAIIANVLKDCSKDTKDYNPQTTVEIIQTFFWDSPDVLDRILYSEISNHIFDDSKRGTIITNVYKLINYTYILRDKGEIDDRCVKWITKFYDHSQLVIYQIESQSKRATKIFLESNSKTKEQFEMQISQSRDTFISEIEATKKDFETQISQSRDTFILEIEETKKDFEAQISQSRDTFISEIEETKKDTETQIKSIEKEYIAILGIFASIILTFVGGMAFSTSVLQNISSVSIYRLLLTVDFLAVVLINTIYILIRFILVINEKNTSYSLGKVKAKQIFNIKVFNCVCIVISIIILIAWVVDVSTLRNILSQCFPWNK